MLKRQIQTTDAPAAIGPYSQAIRAGDFIFYSGQIPLDPSSGTMVDGGIEEQIAAGQTCNCNGIGVRQRALVGDI